MQQRWKLSVAQSLASHDNLPQSPGADTFPEGRLRRVHDRIRRDLRDRPAFRLIDKCAVCARDDKSAFSSNQIAKNSLQNVLCFVAFAIISASMSTLDLY